MSQPLIFDAEERFEISGRGTVFAGYCPDWLVGRSRADSGLLGETVYVSGQPYILKGIERYLPLSNYKLGEPVGLLLEPVTPIARMSFEDVIKLALAQSGKTYDPTTAAADPEEDV